MYKSLAHKIKFDIEKKQHFSTDESLLIRLDAGKRGTVFKIANEMKVIKVFYPGKEIDSRKEIEVYKRLDGSIPYYAKMYDYGDNYLVIDFIEGKRLYDYIVEGIYVEERLIKEVDSIIELSRIKGLNPTDVHFKNIFMTNEGLKIIDLERFLNKEYCRRWDDIKKVYYKYYLKPFFPKKVPSFIIDYISEQYRKGRLKL